MTDYPDEAAALLPKTYVGRDFAYSDIPQLIKGLIPRGSLVWLSGKWGSGKSFVALDLAAHISTGRDWHGHKTRQAKVLYVVAEGGAGMRKRQWAWAREFKADTGVTFMDGLINLRDGKQVDDLGDLLEEEAYDLVVFDTQHACSGGANENDAGEAGEIIDALKDLKDGHPDLTIMLVHHDGETSGKVGRGSTAYPAAMDVIIQVTAEDPHTSIIVTDRKNKDLDSGGPVSLVLRQVVLGQDVDGDDITSCVVEEGPDPLTKPKLADILKEDEGQTARQLAELTGLTPQGVGIQLRSLKTQHKARSVPGEHGREWFKDYPE